MPGRVTRSLTISEFFRVLTVLSEPDCAARSIGASSDSVVSMVVRVVCAPMKMVATKVTPISSAAVVEAVLRGASFTLRATRPSVGERKIFSPTRPISSTKGGTNTRLSSSTPQKAMKAPGSVSVMSPALAPTTVAAAPSAVSTVPSTRRIHGKRESGAGMSAGASASMGDTRVALSAGTKDAATVTVMPTARPSTTARTGRGAVWKFAWTYARRAMGSSMAAPQPTNTPMAELTRPSTAPSARVALRSCERVAPTARRSARERVREATSTWKVFEMTSTATNSATAMKAPMNVTTVAESPVTSFMRSSISWSSVATL